MADRTCTDGDCPSPVRSKNADLCGKHYMRQRRHGSTADPAPPDPRPRFWAKVDKAGPVPEYRPDLGPCWIWLARRASGYGRFSIGSPPNNEHAAHRLSYQWLIGPIPEGLELDHLCRVRRCVRPTHLEPVTRRENLLRGDTIAARHARKTHCPKGHPYDATNTVWQGRMRHCRACTADYQRRLRARRRQERTA